MGKRRTTARWPSCRAVLPTYNYSKFQGGSAYAPIVHSPTVFQWIQRRAADYNVALKTKCPIETLAVYFPGQKKGGEAADSMARHVLKDWYRVTRACGNQMQMHPNRHDSYCVGMFGMTPMGALAGLGRRSRECRAWRRVAGRCSMKETSERNCRPVSDDRTSR